MKTLSLIAASFVVFTSALVCQETRRKSTDIFEATVVRVEPWFPIKITCGVAIVYRLAEYRVDTVYRGHLHAGDDIVVRHLACNGNELDDLNAGDKVIVFARKLAKAEKGEWMTNKFGEEKTFECPGHNDQKCSEVQMVPGDAITIRFDADRLAKLIYPTVRPTK